ncbi:MAG: hypothetical protein HC912_01510 [Saprospiraceae bacterium]|nr:hypothetical protein [Saprospiraceae bacterium]
MMKRRIIGFIILILIISMGGWMLYRMQAKIKQKQIIQENIEHLPNFTFYQIEDSSQFSRNSLVEHRPILLVYFNSECEHCQYEAGEIYKQKINSKILKF